MMLTKSETQKEEEIVRKPSPVNSDRGGEKES